MKKSVFLFALCLAVLGCGHKSEMKSDAEYLIFLDNESGAPQKRVESVSVVEFEVNESWMYATYSSWLTKTSDRWAMVNPEMGRVRPLQNGTIFEDKNDLLLMYDHEGNMTSQRHISGRGPGEVVSVKNLYARGDTVFLYDSSTDKLIGFDKDGKHIFIFRNKESDEAVFKIGNEYVGLDPRGEYYVNVYDQNGKLKGRHSETEAFYRALNLSNGNSPGYYIYKDCVRFIRYGDYTVYSYSNDTVIPVFGFVTGNAIPESLHETEQYSVGDKTYHYFNAVQFIAEVAKGGYDHGFSNLFETEDFLYFQYFSAGTRICLFDKRDGSLYRQSSSYLDYILEEPDYSVKTQDDAWNYLFSATEPHYSEDNSIYFAMRVESFNILRNIPVRADKRLAAFIRDARRYIDGNSLSDEDIFFIRMDLK